MTSSNDQVLPLVLRFPLYQVSCISLHTALIAMRLLQRQIQFTLTSDMNKLFVRIPLERVESRILMIRGEKVILDADLAKLYGVLTKRLMSK